MEVLWWLHKRTPGRLPLHFNIPAGHQSFVSASCSCDNRLWVMTTPGHHRFPRREPRFPPIGTLEAPLPPCGAFPYPNRFGGAFFFADRRIACSAAKSSTDSLIAPLPVSDHQMLQVMQP